MPQRHRQSEQASGRKVPLKVALVSTGLSHAMGPGERLFQDLYEALHDVTQVTLFKASGWSAPPDIIRIPSLQRNHPWLQRLWPQDEARRYRLEQQSMAIGGWLLGHWQGYDIIHFSDPVFGLLLQQLKHQFRYQYELLYTHVGPEDPDVYRHFDHIQECTPRSLEQSKARGIRKTRLHLNPFGIWVERFRPELDIAKIREEWRIPQDKFILLSVTPLSEPADRLSFLIDVVARLNDDRIFLLLADNATAEEAQSPNTAEVIALADSRLAGRYRHIHVPALRMPEIYSVSHLLVQPSSRPCFDRACMAAMAARLPLLAHDYANNQWLMNAPESLIDMEDPEALRWAIVRMQDGTRPSDIARQMAATNAEWVESRFHWNVVRTEIIRMYEQILLLPA